MGCGLNLWFKFGISNATGVIICADGEHQKWNSALYNNLQKTYKLVNKLNVRHNKKYINYEEIFNYTCQ